MRPVKNVLFMCNEYQYLLQQLRQEFNVVMADRDGPQICDHPEEIDAVVSSPFNGLRSDELSQLSNLQVVCCCGVGLDAFDVQGLKARSIQVSNVPGTINGCVADLAIALWLAVTRDLVQADRFVRSGQWLQQRHFPLRPSAHGKKVGVLGLGDIGSLIAKRAQAFDCEIGYHSRHQRSNVNFRYFDCLTDLAEWCDVLFVATVGGEGTKHLVNAEVLSALGPEGFVINISRGSVIAEDDLLQALQNKTIAGAALDVFASEPDIDSRFMDLDNVVLVPHIGSATHETRLAFQECTLDNLRAYAQSRKVINEFKTD